LAQNLATETVLKGPNEEPEILGVVAARGGTYNNKQPCPACGLVRASSQVLLRRRVIAMWRLILRSCLSAFLTATAIQVVGGQQPSEPEAAENRWYVYRDAGEKKNHGEWTNWMPGGSRKLIKVNVADSVDPESGSTCVRIDVTWAPPSWCGIAVASADEYWGEKPGPGYDLRRAKKLVFSARGAKGGEIIHAKVAIAGDKPFGDTAAVPAVLRDIMLKNTWEQFELDVSKIRRDRVITPFCIVTNQDLNPENITVFLDNIYFVLDRE
jgi:hypothetical protein